MLSLPLSYGKDNPSMRWIVLAIACVANFVDLFQSSMVFFGLPAIGSDKHMSFSLTDINWVIVAYTLTFATFLAIGGQLSDRTGPRNTFLVGLFLLVWTNALCAWSNNQSALLAGRALAGVGAALTASLISLLVILSHTNLNWTGCDWYPHRDAAFPRGERKKHGHGHIYLLCPCWYHFRSHNRCGVDNLVRGLAVIVLGDDDIGSYSLRLRFTPCARLRSAFQGEATI